MSRKHFEFEISMRFPIKMVASPEKSQYPLRRPVGVAGCQVLTGAPFQALASELLLWGPVVEPLQER